MIQASKQANRKDRAMFTNFTTSPTEVTELSADQLDDIHGGAGAVDIINFVLTLAFYADAKASGATVVTPPA
jgi:hypothetical protein